MIDCTLSVWLAGLGGLMVGLGVPAIWRQLSERARFAAAFAEWERRYREAPDEFVDDMARLATSTPDYGDLCAAYFLERLRAFPLLWTVRTLWRQAER